MDNGEWIVRQLLQSGPILLVYLAGIVACIVFWKRGPRAAGFALIGLVILLLGNIGGNVAMYVIINEANRDGIADMSAMMLSFSMVRSCGVAVGIGLLIAAVFVDRWPRPDSHDFD